MDIRTVAQRLARVTNAGVPLLPAGLRRAMLQPDAPAQQQPQQRGAEAESSAAGGSRKRPRTEEAGRDFTVDVGAPGGPPSAQRGELSLL